MLVIFEKASRKVTGFKKLLVS